MMDKTNTTLTELTVTESTTDLAEATEFKRKSLLRRANQALKYSAVFWFITVLLGQWFFFYYIMAFYGFSVINDNMEIWNRWEVFGVKPYHAGDFSGNLAFAAHAIGAGIVAFGGALQLIPKVRQYFPRFHKINGYVFLTTVICLSLSGFYLVWFREPVVIKLSDIGTSINGILILTFAYLTVRKAIDKDINSHRKWAIRLFLVSNAQWFLRLGVFSYLVSGTMLGLNPATSDPFFPFWTFGCFLVPLATLEMYFYAKEKGTAKFKLISSGILVALTVLMLIGMLGFTPFLISVMTGGNISI